MNRRTRDETEKFQAMWTTEQGHLLKLFPSLGRSAPQIGQVGAIVSPQAICLRTSAGLHCSKRTTPGTWNSTAEQSRDCALCFDKYKIFHTVALRFNFLEAGRSLATPYLNEDSGFRLHKSVKFVNSHSPCYTLPVPFIIHFLLCLYQR